MEEENEARDQELENTVGNLLIAEYQVNKLRDRVTDKIGNRLSHKTHKGESTYMFKNDDRWVKISINVEEMAIDKRNDDEEYNND